MKDTQAYVDNIYEKSVFCDSVKLKKFLSLSQKKMVKVLEKDPAFQLAQNIFLTYKGEVEPNYYEFYLKRETLMKKFVAAQREFMTDKKFFADANSTLRLTYGKIEGTAPRDGMEYTYFTTLDGIIQKNNTGAEDFEIPVRLRELWAKKDFGPYATDGDLRVCLLGSNHTTGGNSGSPALNGEGHLIGINFDRSWESTMSDVMFDPSICRNIMVDIKYVLWVIDKYAGAGHLVQEMELVDADFRTQEIEKERKAKIKEYTNRLRDVPNDIYALMGRAAVYRSMGMMTEHKQDVDAGLMIDAKNVSLLNDKAKYLEGDKDYTKALAVLKQSLSINSSDNVEAYFTRGWIYANQGKYREAISDFDKVIAIDYTYADAYYRRGICHLEMGDTDESCRNFEIAKNMGHKKAADFHHLDCEFGAW
jgi:Tfp pilus assembly protein PilF